MWRVSLRFAVLAFAFFGTLSERAVAQSKEADCKVYFAMFLYDHDLDIEAAPAMDTDQSKWLKGKGGKKYPGFCWDYEKATYVM
ncbi:MAG: hypothetical protein ACRD6I_10105, partial [Candidatus Acidiferrales bacterium]